MIHPYRQQTSYRCLSSSGEKHREVWGRIFALQFPCSIFRCKQRFELEVFHQLFGACPIWFLHLKQQRRVPLS